MITEENCSSAPSGGQNFEKSQAPCFGGGFRLEKENYPKNGKRLLGHFRAAGTFPIHNNGRLNPQDLDSTKPQAGRGGGGREHRAIRAGGPLGHRKSEFFGIAKIRLLMPGEEISRMAP